MLDPTTIDPLPDEPDPDHGFWSQTDELAHIHRFARARRVSPYATLGCVLRRATACIEPDVVLPPTIGGYASVNLYTASAGVSGQGKGAADAAGSAAVYFYDDKVKRGHARPPASPSGFRTSTWCAVSATAVVVLPAASQRPGESPNRRQLPTPLPAQVCDSHQETCHLISSTDCHATGE